MPQVHEFRSCNRSSNIQIFTKLRSLSLIPKAFMKWKKSFAVLLRESSSPWDRFLQAFRLKRILQRVILLSVLVIFSVPNSIFSTISRSSFMMKCFKPSKPKELKNKISVFGSMSNILHQCMPGLLLLSVFAIIKVYFPSEEIIAAWSINSYNSREKHQQN